jgi:hypothetical protein
VKMTPIVDSSDKLYYYSDDSAHNCTIGWLNIMNDILIFGIPAYIALVISAWLFVQDIIRYYLKPHMLTQSFIVLGSENNQSLVLFRIIIVNDSPRGRTILGVRLETSSTIKIEPASWSYDNEYTKVNALLPNSKLSNPFPISEVSQGPIDIPSHQSRNKWVGFTIDYTNVDPLAKEVVNGELLFSIVAYGIGKKELARIFIHIPLAQLRKFGVYRIKQNLIPMNLKPSVK